MTYDAIIVGAGFGGMGAAIQLKKMGYHNLLILDREDDLGGTWHVNHYPGLAVDIPSATYSYSFEPNPYWSRQFAPGSELKKYAQHVADKYDVRQYMRFGISVERAQWDESSAQWEVTTTQGEKHRGTYLFTATGFLSQPKLPDIDGLDEYAGEIVHTADWQEDVTIDGARIAVIGTGATSVQLVPEIAPHAKELTVYQRTAIWVSIKPDFRVPGWLKWLYAKIPFTQKISRFIGITVLEALSVIGVLKYRRWSVTNRIAERLSRWHMKRQVHDPEVRAKLTPDYSFGCKRPTYSNNYFPTFNRDNVHLETTPIQRFDKTGIITTDGRRRDIDTLVLATGFSLWESNFPAFEVIGREGKNLGEWWRSTRFQAYEGVTMPGFPNLMSLNSPYSFSGLSYFLTIECQMKHMNRLFGHMKQQGATVFEITEAANQRFLDDMTERLQDSLFVLGQCATANSYYYNQHGEATLLRPTSTYRAHREATRFPVADYALSS